MRYVFHPEALPEYAEAVQYYAEQRVGIAQVFLMLSRMQFTGLENLLSVMQRLMRMSDDV